MEKEPWLLKVWSRQWQEVVDHMDLISGKSPFDTKGRVFKSLRWSRQQQEIEEMGIISWNLSLNTNGRAYQPRQSVYEREPSSFHDLRNVSAFLASAIHPPCPDRKRSILANLQKRYNCVIDRVALDETCKWLLIKGRINFESLGYRIMAIVGLFNFAPEAGIEEGQVRATQNMICSLNDLSIETLIVSKKKNAEYQRTEKPMDVISLYRKLSDDKTLSILHQMNGLGISTAAFDNQVTPGAWLIQIQTREIFLHDRFSRFFLTKKVSFCISSSWTIDISLAWRRWTHTFHCQ